MLSDKLLYVIAKRWPSPVKNREQNVGIDPNRDDFHFNYALHRQFLFKVRTGFKEDFFEKKVLEIGCGHGGISTFLAVNGASEVHGIDINKSSLEGAAKFKAFMDGKLGLSGKLPVFFHEMSAFQMSFEDNSFDLVVADNIFEHIMDLDLMMNEIRRILKPGGLLVIPSFNSIYSKHGLHLKHGLKLPWANVLFSEKTICRTMTRLAKDNPLIYEYYPGLINNPQRVKDLRKHGDLNGITYGKFRRLVKKHEFSIKNFNINPPGNSLVRNLLKFTHRLPLVNKTLWVDIASANASAVLKKN